MKRFLQSLSLCLVVGLWSGCAKVEERVEPSAWVTIQPQKFFVERVAGGTVAVEVLVRPGQSPETYAPSASQMAKLAKADVYFGIGMPVEARLFNKMAQSMPDVSLVSLREPVEHAHHEHHAGCVHGDEDPHVWLDPAKMVEFVEQVAEALSGVVPDSEGVFRDNAAQLVAELSALDRELAERFASYKGRAFYINHPSLGHLAERYGLHQLSIEQGGAAPSARRVAELVADARIEKVGAIFTQPEFGQSSARVLAEALHVEMIEINPLAEDYFANMRLIADGLEGSFAR